MEVTDELVEKLAHLARLRFDDNEREKIRKDLEKMIGFVDQLAGLDLEGVEPLLHMSDESDVLRDDVVAGSITREKALRNAPKANGEYFRVPTVIKAPENKG